jgi:kinesin family protein 5
MLEIYKEQFIDLLKGKEKQSRELKLMSSAAKGNYVEGLTSVMVSGQQQIMDLINFGLENRHTGQTRQNQQSSRSHSIFIIEVLQYMSNNIVQRGCINLVDLAGSERVSKSAADGLALEEAKKINQSLSALGKVINSISKNKSHVPYRDSKLTRLL